MPDGILHLLETLARRILLRREFKLSFRLFLACKFKNESRKVFFGLEFCRAFGGSEADGDFVVAVEFVDGRAFEILGVGRIIGDLHLHGFVWLGGWINRNDDFIASAGRFNTEFVAIKAPGGFCALGIAGPLAFEFFEIVRGFICRCNGDGGCQSHSPSDDFEEIASHEHLFWSRA